MTEVSIVRQCSEAESKDRMEAWYDYCITNRLIAYGEVPKLTEEWIEAHCKEQLEKDCEEIRRKYEHINKNGKRS